MTARVWIAAVIGLVALVACSEPTGRLDLRILDGSQTTPARVELIDAAGKAWTSPDALKVVLECLASPPPAWLQAGIESREIANPYTGTTQFYAAGHASVELPPGDYELRVFKGTEYRVHSAELAIEAGGTKHLDVALERWADPAAEGWYGSDDHIHLTRRSADANPWLLAWMEAEGLSVANLLTMGTADQFTVTPQYAYGDAGVYGGGATRLFAGQEHPRTHFLGHTITLGATEPIDLRASYIHYESFWRESERLGGVSGFAHFGQGPAQDGLSISAPAGRVHFIELLQTEYLATRVWYELLDMGFRIAPSAGTDFPCIPSLPGRERVYVSVDGELTRAGYVAGLRAGRTFVTNGPLLELQVDGTAIGGTVRLASAGTVRVVGAVRFDPERDGVRSLELVAGGHVVRTAETLTEPGRIEIAADVPIEHTTWLALRSVGDKLGEVPILAQPIPAWMQAGIDRFGGGWSMEGRDEFIETLELRPSLAHTGAVFVEVAGRQSPKAAVHAREWIARLDALEARLGDDRIDEIEVWHWLPYSDAVSVEHVRGQRPKLIEDIAAARRHYEKIAGGSP